MSGWQHCVRFVDISFSSRSVFVAIITMCGLRYQQCNVEFCIKLRTYGCDVEIIVTVSWRRISAPKKSTTASVHVGVMFDFDGVVEEGRG